jgi:hypothetical protein
MDSLRRNSSFPVALYSETIELIWCSSELLLGTCWALAGGSFPRQSGQQSAFQRRCVAEAKDWIVCVAINWYTEYRVTLQLDVRL